MSIVIKNKHCHCNEVVHIICYLCWRNCIIDKNAKIGKDVIIQNKDVSVILPLIILYSLLFSGLSNLFVS